MSLLEAKDVRIYFQTRAGIVKAVDGVSFTLEKGEILGIAGESGCGKTTLALSIIRLLPKNAIIAGGQMIYDGKNLLEIDYDEIRKIRWGKISMVFQGAMNALNPVFRVGDQIVEAILLHEDISKEEAEDRAKELLKKVGISPERFYDYPHEFSGGMKQRAVIAMALACNPDIIIADEPTTALDVTIQAQILDLLKTLQRTMKLSVILITHDLGVIAELSDKIMIMYAGKPAENASTRELINNPLHPYTRALLTAIPSIESRGKKLANIRGIPPNLIVPPPGCRFHPRCDYARPICSQKEPEYKEVKPGHWVACHFYEQFL